jgi:hypothetical protein
MVAFRSVLEKGYVPAISTRITVSGDHNYTEFSNQTVSQYRAISTALPNFILMFFCGYLKVLRTYSAIVRASLSETVATSNLIIRDIGLRIILTISSGLFI